MARILVIDDEAGIRLTVAMALEQVGHTVEEAADAVEGLEKLGKAGGWDLVLLDQRMPGMEGLEVLRYIKGLDPSANVVMMTAFGTLDLALDAMEAGATDFLRKPFPLETLRGAVQAALWHHAVAAPSTAGGPDESAFHRVTLNGFLIEPLRKPARRRSGEIHQAVAVRSPNGNLTACIVVFPPDLVERIGRSVGDTKWPVADRLWRELAEDMMAHYLWENACVPMGGILRRSEYEPHLRRWLGAVVGPGSTGS